MTVKNEKNTEIYQFGDLSRYSLGQRISIRAADLFFFILISLIGKTLKYEVRGAENETAATTATRKPIYAFWHNRIFPTTYFFKNRGIVVMSSQSFDGEYIARFIQRFGYGAVRGSPTRGGIGALVAMIRLAKSGFPTAFTIDGPRGPKYTAKPGACLLAKKSGNPILPLVIESKRFFEIKSWDRLQIPKPFSDVLIVLAAPVEVPSDADENVLKAKLAELQKSLDELVKIGEQWRTNEI